MVKDWISHASVARPLRMQRRLGPEVEAFWCGETGFDNEGGVGTCDSIDVALVRGTPPCRLIDEVYLGLKSLHLKTYHGD